MRFQIESWFLGTWEWKRSRGGRIEPIYNVRTVRIASMRQRLFFVCTGFVVAAGIALDAQWIKLPTPGLPRLPDGKPNLTAPAPRTADGKPDLSGLWQNDGGDRYYNNVLVDYAHGDVAPWAHELS